LALGHSGLAAGVAEQSGGSHAQIIHS
jgi:hypothetical protein